MMKNLSKSKETLLNQSTNLTHSAHFAVHLPLTDFRIQCHCSPDRSISQSSTSDENSDRGLESFRSTDPHPTEIERRGV